MAVVTLPGLGSLLDLALFGLGWLAGWVLLWRLRPLPTPTGRPMPRSIAVVVPARDEERAIEHVVAPIARQRRPGDELIVVDDHSADATGALAAAAGARVVSPPPLPDGWLGKPHACWHGAGQTDADILLFLDADVRPPEDLLARVEAAVDRHPDDVVSVQPWHTTGGAVEQASLLCNATALMGSGAFTPFGERVHTRAAFGPVIALRRSVYDAVGGHADPVIRQMHTEDIGLARAVGRSRLHSGRPDITFRMYPGGFRELVAGWTRSIATGARYTPWWAVLGVAVWVWSLAGGWIASPLVYPLSAVQVWVLGRRAGSMHPVTAILYPIATAVLVVVFVRSLFALVTGREVAWKGRRVPARSAD